MLGYWRNWVSTKHSELIFLLENLLILAMLPDINVFRKQSSKACWRGNERGEDLQTSLTTSNRHLVLALPRQPELPQTADSGVLSYKPHRHLCLLRNFRERERLLHMICILKSNMAAKISDKMAAISWNCHISDFLYRSLLTLILVALCRFIRSGNSKLWHFLTRLYNHPLCQNPRWPPKCPPK